MTQPYQPLYLDGTLVGWTLPDLNKIENRTQRVQDANRMRALLHAMSDPHYKAEDAEFHRYGQAIVRNVYLNNTSTAPNFTQTPQDYDPFNNLESNLNETSTTTGHEFTRKKLELRLAEPHIPRSSSTRAHRDTVRENIRGLVEEITGPVYSAEELRSRAYLLQLIAKRKEQPVQVPLQDELHIPKYTPDAENQRETGVVVTDIDGAEYSPRVIITDMDGTEYTRAGELRGQKSNSFYVVGK